MVLTIRVAKAGASTVVGGIRKAHFLGTDLRFAILTTSTRVAIIRNGLIRLTDRLYFPDQ